MIYDYKLYEYQMCTIPMIKCLVTVSIIIPMTVYIVQIITKKRLIPFEWKNRIDESGLIIMVLILMVIFSANAIKLARGGIYLIIEDPSDSIHISGTIESCFETNSFFGADYGVEENNGFGEGIVINGVTYWVTTYKDLTTGETIDAEILPKSHFVLSWERLASTHSDDINMDKN